jgi:hypothetical protein
VRRAIGGPRVVHADPSGLLVDADSEVAVCGTVSSWTILKTGTNEISMSFPVYSATTLFHFESAASCTYR